MTLKTIEWKDNSVVMIDQTKLPNILEYVTYTDFNQVADAIRTLVIRGAPAIGVSGAFGLALASLQSAAANKDELDADGYKQMVDTAIRHIKKNSAAAGFQYFGKNISGIINNGVRRRRIHMCNDIARL